MSSQVHTRRLQQSPHPRLREHCREGSRKNIRSVSMGENCETLTSGHGRAVVHINFQQLWLPVQDQASHNTARTGEGAKASSLELLREGDSLFFGDVIPGRFPLPLWMSLHTRGQH